MEKPNEYGDRSLFARITPSGDVEIVCPGITATDYLTILAALEGVAEEVVTGAK